ncbi:MULTISPECIES: M20/M25/M40 family metallo-hydrolase [unclassified Leptolyngbya]|uniref:M20/M25/M40 family metallo-hydrolase n=1 Tax=unclassified Leptolyngbya TaxID=2650499 RepID=UPI001682C33C|nr:MULTISPECIES: M20/M25/M40 family metallo-hydrolase [unclassified Leptolyngbya]MBD1910325.1 M20/M25/M40 family metallo-hydrolase [Leptolyngbya sp. FACHB-8]MBD2154872.1 M20/M25/M40 family metallo-hydrolase [Leptolyngbya sp. FACHB-16]
MRRFKLLIGLFTLALLISLGGWSWFRGLSEPAPQVKVEYPVEALRVDGDRLLAHVEALAFERADPVSREQARSYLTDALQTAGWAVTEQTFEWGVNLVADRPGTDPMAGVVILGAHYDTVVRSPGADDNATGLAAVLEAARIFHSLDTRRTLRLVLFDLEEAGLLGSQAFVTNLADSGQMDAVVLDMIGYRCTEPGCQSYPPLPIPAPSETGTFLAVIGDQGHGYIASAFHQYLDAALPPVFTLNVPLLGPLRPDMLRSDHAPFWDEGIGAALVTDTANFRNPHYHQSTDTPETLDPEFFEGAAQVVINALFALLNRG